MLTLRLTLNRMSRRLFGQHHSHTGSEQNVFVIIIKYLLVLLLLVGTAFSIWRFNRLLYERCGISNLGKWSVGMAWGKDHRGLHYSDRPGQTCQSVTDTISTFVADPFILKGDSHDTFHPVRTPIPEENIWQLYFEVFDVNTNQGDIGMSISKDSGRTWNYVGIVLDEPFHLSYPFVFRDGVRQFMIPEAHDTNCVRLYELLHSKWIFLDNLLCGRRFADASIVLADGHWYMWVHASGELFLYHSANLLKGWQEHPHSPLRRHESPTANRPGGRPFVNNDGHILLPTQNNAVTYGGSIDWFVVTKVSPTEYLERSDAHSLPLPSSVWISQRIHHVDAHPTAHNTGLIASVDGDSVQNRRFTYIGIFVIVVYLITFGAICRYSLFELAGLELVYFFMKSRLNKLIVVTSVLMLVGCIVHVLLRNRWQDDGSLRSQTFTAHYPQWLEDSYPKTSTRLSNFIPPLPNPDFPDLDQCDFTIVTALYDIGRGNMDSRKEKRTFDTYLRYFEDLLALTSCIVIYVDPAHVPFVENIRKDGMRRTVIIGRKHGEVFDDYIHRDLVEKMVANKTYVSLVNRPDRPEMLIPGYNIVCFRKVDFVVETTHSNPFRSKYFAWVDAGYGHGKLMKGWAGKNWPSAHRVTDIVGDHQIYMVRQRPWTRHDCTLENQRSYAIAHHCFISGGIMVGTAQPFREAQEVIQRNVEKTLSAGFMDDDQAVFWSAACEKPELFKFEDCPTNLACYGVLGRGACWDSLHCTLEFLLDF